MTNISNWFFRLAVLYLIAGVSLGLFMAASHDHSMFPVHAHLNLLGWVSMALFGAFYRFWPEAATTKLAKIHFWVYVPAHFLMMVFLFLLFRGMPSIEPALAAASMVVGAAVVVFAVNVWMHTGERAASAAIAPGTIRA